MHILRDTQCKLGYTTLTILKIFSEFTIQTLAYEFMIHTSIRKHPLKIIQNRKETKIKIIKNRLFRYLCMFIKIPGRLSVLQNVFDQMHKPQFFQGHFCQASLKPCHEQPIAQLKQLHLLCPVSLHHLVLQ